MYQNENKPEVRQGDMCCNYRTIISKQDAQTFNKP